MKKKIVPKKNYIIFLIIAICTVVLSLYLACWYKTLEDYTKNNSVVSEIIYEIESDSFSSYLLDNPDIVVYISSSKDESVKGFEKQFKKIIVNNDLSNSIVFLDIAKEENSQGPENLKLNFLTKKYLSLKEIPYPNLIKFENGEIIDMLYVKKNKITKDDVVKFLKKNGLIE